MNPCKGCGTISLANIIIHTETTFGHGDSSHKTYVKCAVCGTQTVPTWGYGFFEDSDLRKVQEWWNEGSVFKPE